MFRHLSGAAIGVIMFLAAQTIFNIYEPSGDAGTATAAVIAAAAGAVAGYIVQNLLLQMKVSEFHD